MIFETERLILRPWEEEDAVSLYKYAKDPKVGPIAGWPVHTSVDNSREIIKDVLSANETYAVCLKKNNVAIGSIGLIPPVQSHTYAAEDEIEVGYWIGVPFWGQGLIPEAVRVLQRHAFLDLGCSAMWCGYYDGNEKSKRCQEKCGFHFHHTEYNKPCLLMGDVRTEHFTRLTKEEWQKRQDEKVIFYVHGKGGSVEEAEHYKQFFDGWDVYGFDYKSENPWDAKEEFSAKVKELAEKYSRIILIAGSIGAYFSMNAGIGSYIEKAYFISPIVNMEKLILDMISWAGTSESELEKRKIIPVDFGDDLSWEYLRYVRHHKIYWNVPTEILYGSTDHLQSMNTIDDFARETGAGLTVMKGGEHWFHTEDQMKFLDKWFRKKMKKKKVAFICVHNSCRSQIAEALGRHLAGDVFESYSAGTETKPQINQDAVRLMKEIYDIDMEANGQSSKLISEIPEVDLAISMGCNVGCPFIGRGFDDNWGLEDPTGKSDEEFKIIIKEIETKILALKKQASEK